MIRRLACLTAIVALTASATLAHEVAKGPNGGPVVDSGGHHVEMVAKGPDLVLFLTGEADKPLASAGVKNARAVVQDGGPWHFSRRTRTSLSACLPSRAARCSGRGVGYHGRGPRRPGPLRQQLTFPLAGC